MINEKNHIFPQLSLLERYLISELIPPLLFSIITVTIVAESIGISFEQFSFLMAQQLSVENLIYIHILKLPAFIIFSLPVAILMTTILVYNKLSNTSEVIALHNCGLSLYKLTYPAINLGIVLTLILFICNELIVPPANYKAAITLEQAMNVNRTMVKTHDIIYKELDSKKYGELSDKNNHLKYLFYAERFTMGKMREVTLLIRDAERLKVIIKSQVAEWDQQQKYWYFSDGVISMINPDGSYGHRIKFEKLPLDLPNISLQFQLDMENIDYREMNIFQAYQRLLVFHKAGDNMNIRKLQVNIQERFTLPVSCAVFAFLGSAIGINLQPRVKYNSFSVTLGIILLYDVIKVITNTLIISEYISLYCIWLPNIVAIGVGYYLLLKKTFAY